MLQTLLTYPPGPWADVQEKAYRKLSAEVGGLIRTGDIQTVLSGPQHHRWSLWLSLFQQLCFKRLCVYLRHREPDDHVGYSILIYRLSDQEIQSALFGPPKELEPEDPDVVVYFVDAGLSP
jgi:hypothetical protein